MTNSTVSLDYLEISANILALNLDRNNIFPPLLNDPKIILQNKRQRKRAPNAFFICRMNVQKEVTRYGIKYNMRIVSKAASILWSRATPEEKHQYVIIANMVKELYSNPTIENSYNPYYSFQLTSQSHSIITEYENFNILYFQTQHYYSNFQILSNAENIFNDTFNNFFI